MSNAENKIEKHYIVFHDDDHDGYCAAFVVYNEKKSPTTKVEFIPVHNRILGRPVLPDTVCGVYFVDVCPAVTYVQDLLDSGIEVCIIDHHEHTKETFTDFEHALLKKNIDVSSSSCLLAWEYFNTAPAPWVVCKIHEWDTWTHADPQVIPFHYGLDCLDITDKKLWRQFFKEDASVISEIMRMGHIAGTYHVRAMNTTVGMLASEAVINHHVVLLCNGRFSNSYEFAGTLDPKVHKALGWWVYDPEDECAILTIKTDREDVDCMAILQEWNPVGNKQSATVRVPVETILKCIKEYKHG